MAESFFKASEPKNPTDQKKGAAMAVLYGHGIRCKNI